jgi:nucleoside-diphosphate-sugar epimerase
MTPPHVVLGAGQAGLEIARQLLENARAVRVVTRDGRDVGIPGVESFPADVTDPAQVRTAVEGARVAYFAVAPPYHRPEDFPPLVDGSIAGLAGTGVRLVVVDNLYLYGPTGGAPIREDLPYRATGRKGRVRAEMAERFLAAHRDARVPVTICRASDFFGPRAPFSPVGERFWRPLVTGKAPEVFGNPGLPRTYTYLPDFARALIELGSRDEALGSAWHVPSAPPVTTLRFVEMAARAAGVRPRISRVSRTGLRIAGLFMPEAKETVELWYEFDQPYVVDSSRFEAIFRARATPLEESIPATVAWWRDRAATPRTAG